MVREGVCAGGEAEGEQKRGGSKCRRTSEDVRNQRGGEGQAEVEVVAGVSVGRNSMIIR